MRLKPSALLIAVTLLATLVVACGSDTTSGTSTSAAATALRRDQAIATFTAEAAAHPTATRFPVATPTTAAAEAPIPSPAPAPDERSFSEEQQADITELEALLLIRSQAMSVGDFETWYDTCAPQVRESAIETDALGRQLRAIKFEPDGTSTIEFVLEEVFFSGSTAATVLWGVRDGADYFSGLGGSFIKEDDEWFSIGWGCT